MNKRKKMHNFIFGCVFLFIILLTLKKAISSAESSPENIMREKIEYQEKKNNLLIGINQTKLDLKNVKEYKLPVPLISQMDEPTLRNGCEVTALTMLLNYYGFNYNKNELQDKIVGEPYKDKNGLYGDPDIGFVGDATGLTPGVGVNVGPIVELAETALNKSVDIINSSGVSLDELLTKVQEGHPIWIITTIDYSIPKEEDFLKWNTRNGMKNYSSKHHAAVIIGFSENEVYLNDAFGKEVSVDKASFERIYNGMGQQSMYITKKIS